MDNQGFSDNKNDIGLLSFVLISFAYQDIKKRSFLAFFFTFLWNNNS
jgi:hypothetical protein